ncbi:Uncharacterised protein [Mycobacteroides abscessus subsp. abscessus]|nr:Uncharacterised protein [Mycobacteroides abscessus subsp. abscessus]
MPMKCMDQMPRPMASAPPVSHTLRATPVVARTRLAIPSAVYDARMATQIDSTTRAG